MQLTMICPVCENDSVRYVVGGKAIYCGCCAKPLPKLVEQEYVRPLAQVIPLRPVSR